MWYSTANRFNCSFLLVISMGVSLYAPAVPAADFLTLDKALATAMLNSPDIRRTELDLERSRESLNAQRAALKSSFSLKINPLTYSRDRTFNRFFSVWNDNKSTESSSVFTISQPIVKTDGTLSLNNQYSWQDSYSAYNDVHTKTFDNNLYLSFQQPLFTYKRTELELSELELDLENTMYSYAIQKLSLEQDVTRSFFDVYQLKMDLDIAREDLENRTLSYDIIKNKVDAGLSAEEELFQAELNLSSSELSVQNSMVSLENALDDFKLLLGISLYDSIDVEASVEMNIVKIDAMKAIDNGLKNRLELRQREISVQYALNTLTRTAAQNEFRGDLTLTYGIIGTDEQAVDVFDKPTNRGSVGLSLTVPLWDWGEKKSRIKAQEASIKRQQISIEDERNSIILTIKRAHRNIEKLLKQIDISNKNVRNAQLTYDINLERYKNGDLTSMDLNLFQNQLSQAKMNVIQTMISYRLELLNMKILSLWDFETNQPVLPEYLN